MYFLLSEDLFQDQTISWT